MPYPGWPHPGYSCPEPSKQESGEEVFPQAAERVNVRAQGHHHGQAGELWGGEAGDAAQCGPSATSVFEQPRGELPPADPPAGAAHAAVQVVWTRPALPRSLWPHRPALPPAAPPVPGARVSSGDAATLPNLGGDHRLSHGHLRADREIPLLPLCLLISSRRINLTTPSRVDVTVQLVENTEPLYGAYQKSITWSALSAG
jgi:hypothetical protein